MACVDSGVWMYVTDQAMYDNQHMPVNEGKLFVPSTDGQSVSYEQMANNSFSMDGAPQGGLWTTGLVMNVDAPVFQPQLGGSMRADAPVFMPGQGLASMTQELAAYNKESTMTATTLPRPGDGSSLEPVSSPGSVDGDNWATLDCAGTSETLKALALELPLGFAEGGDRAQAIRRLQALLARHRRMEDSENSVRRYCSPRRRTSSSTTPSKPALRKQVSEDGTALRNASLEVSTAASSDDEALMPSKNESLRQAASPTAWWRAGERSTERDQPLGRVVQGLLNKVCPENVDSIGSKLCNVRISSAEDLDSLAHLLFKKARADTHYGDTYADLAFQLSGALPKFHVDGLPEPKSFSLALREAVLQEIAALPAAAERRRDGAGEENLDAEEIEARRMQQKAHMLASVRFAGRLFLRRLIPVAEVSSALVELIGGNSEELPEEIVLDCACELLLSIGYTLQEMPGGARAIGKVMSRLSKLAKRKGAYSKRLEFQVQDLAETRAAGWKRKVFQSSAKTKSDIRSEQKRDMASKKRGVSVEHGEMQVAGKSPTYITEALRPGKGCSDRFAMQ